MAVSFNHASKIKGEQRTGERSLEKAALGDQKQALFSAGRKESIPVQGSPEHSCSGIPSDINERTLYLAKKGKSRLKNIVSGFENLLHAFIAIQWKVISKTRRFLYLMPYSLQFGKSKSKPCFSIEFSLWSWKSPFISPWKVSHQFSKEFQLLVLWWEYYEDKDVKVSEVLKYQSNKKLQKCTKSVRIIQANFWGIVCPGSYWMWWKWDWGPLMSVQWLLCLKYSTVRNRYCCYSSLWKQWIRLCSQVQQLKTIAN